VARNQNDSCKFRGLKNNAAAVVGNGNATGDGMRQRIDHLEELVKGLINEQQQTEQLEKKAAFTPQSPEADATTESSASPFNGQESAGTGQTVIDGNHSVYLGDNDWYTVLQEVRANHTVEDPLLTETRLMSSRTLGHKSKSRRVRIAQMPPSPILLTDQAFCSTRSSPLSDWRYSHHCQQRLKLIE
jgi:hypothetical protein